MGRKSIDKERILDPEKRGAMAALLLPQIEGRSLVGLTMDDLAVMIGKSKATIYKHFRSREELFELSLEHKLERIRGFVPLLMDTSQPYLDRYFQALELLFTELATVSNDFLSSLRVVNPALWQKIEALQEFAGQILKDYYKEGVQKGMLEPIHPAVLVLSDRFMFDALCNPEFLGTNNLSIREAFEAYFHMKFFGLVKK